MPFRFCVNPAGRELPDCSAVLNGRVGSRAYIVAHHRTTLSIKSVTRGHAFYCTASGRYRVDADCFLLLNHGQEYALEIPAGSNTETLCPFFQPGLLEHVAGSVDVPPERLLDDIGLRCQPVDFCERLYPKRGALADRLHAISSRLRANVCSTPWLEDQFHGLAEDLLALDRGVQVEMQAFPGCRRSTREELYRRLHRARDWMDASFTEAVTISQIARVACLSPYHFQRMFRLAFGQTAMQYLQEKRLRAAQSLLAHTEQDITSICFEVGFESLGSFSWLFGKRFGASPRAYRRAHRQM